MKTIVNSILAGLAGLMLLAYAAPAFAADLVTITGEGKCAKCALHETSSCQNTVTKTEDGKKVTYYIVQNDIAKEFHENICKGPKQITVTGSVSDVDGKKTLTATKIELAK